MSQKKDKNPAMRIIKLEASNIKKLKAVEFKPNRFVNRISGANGSGKTSILDSIEWTLIGGKNVPTTPVRKGAQSGRVKLHMGEGETVDVILTRSFYEGGAKRAGRLSVEVMPGKDGSAFEDKRKRIANPDDLQDKLLGQVSFDPLEFMRMEPKKQYHVLRRISIQDIDLDELDLTNQEKTDRRREAGRIKDEREKQLRRFDNENIPENLSTEKKDVNGLVQELTEVSQFNAGIESERLRRKAIEDNHERNLQTIAAKKKELENLKAEIATFEANAKQTGVTIAGWKPLEEPRDAQELAEQINEARTINRMIERAGERDIAKSEFDRAHAAWKTLDDEVKEGERRKMEAIALAQYPIDGLGVENEEVTFKGIPFDQASQAEQIRISAAIGMQANNAVRVMRIKDGSLLDDDSLEILAELAHTQDYQIIIETVDTTGKIGFYLEEGELAAVNDEPLNAPLLIKPEKPKRQRKPKTEAK